MRAKSFHLLVIVGSSDEVREPQSRRSGRSGIGANVLPYGPLSPRKPSSSASPFVGRPFPCASYCGLACGLLNSLKEPKVLVNLFLASLKMDLLNLVKFQIRNTSSTPT